MTKEDYESSVDSLSSGMALVMKRNPKDCWVNGYNADLLRAWDANMDIQYVVDEYSCTEYMMAYLTKPEHEMTEILNTVIDRVKKSDLNHDDEMKIIMQAYSKHQEVSAQEVLYGDQVNSPNAVPLLNDAGYIQKRTLGKPAIIQFARFSLTKQPEKYYRRILKLYLPHRRDQDLKSKNFPTYKDFYFDGLTKEIKDYVDFNQMRYEGHGKKINKVMEKLQLKGPIVNAWNTFAPEVELDRLECLAQREPIEQDPEEEVEPLPDYQLHGDLPLIQAPKLSFDFVRAMCRSLNETQASLFYAVRDWCLRRVWGCNPDPFYYFLTGGAGCGKSHVIKCVYEEANKVLRQLPRFRDVCDMSRPTMLLTAFTEAAAFNISGKTLHSILRLPKSLKPPYRGLGNTLDEVRALLGNAEILILDEVAMVSKELFAYVDMRFQQIKRISKPFGGMSVLDVGDFYQLPPVGRAKALCVHEVDDHNAAVVASLSLEVVDVWAQDFRKDKMGKRLVLLHCVSGRKQELPDKSQAAVGAQVMLIRNQDVEDGLVNGTFGTIANIVTTTTEDGKPFVKLIALQLDNLTAGSKHKSKDNLVYIERLEEQTSIKSVAQLQFPMKLAFGCTTHKVQGMSLTSAVICLKWTFEPGMAYVALSLTTSLEGLRIVNYDESKVYADENIRTAMESMTPASFLDTSPLLHFV
ncbi:ATP-dependent DNA helicase PIF1-like, partial [Denticeps clupeoides]|uniref:ATP-dependent DNA helicase PIF1-like n=1 Tax=Denticeps clupeoides TaxID=299321 RepID=UPI0010A4B063